MAYRSELEALRARLAAVERERDRVRERLRRLESGGSLEAPAPRGQPAMRVSVPGGEPVTVTIENRSETKLVVIWLSPAGNERRAGTLVSEGRIRVQTYVGYCWRLIDAATRDLLHEVRIEPGQLLVRYDG